eukprot:10661567-Alexandrium_andersonii.AAC.1
MNLLPKIPVSEQGPWFAGLVALSAEPTGLASHALIVQGQVEGTFNRESQARPHRLDAGCGRSLASKRSP